jgi:hypothetical protein
MAMGFPLLAQDDPDCPCRSGCEGACARRQCRGLPGGALRPGAGRRNR